MRNVRSYAPNYTKGHIASYLLYAIDARIVCVTNPFDRLQLSLEASEEPDNMV